LLTLAIFNEVIGFVDGQRKLLRARIQDNAAGQLFCAAMRAQRLRLFNRMIAVRTSDHVNILKLVKGKALSAKRKISDRLTGMTRLTVTFVLSGRGQSRERMLGKSLGSNVILTFQALLRISLIAKETRLSPRFALDLLALCALP
jgi:hypothetical protein